VVEDEPTLVLTLTDRLRAEGYEVDSAETGEEGLRKARDGSFDIVLLDVALPREGGLRRPARPAPAAGGDAGRHAHRPRPGGGPRARPQARGRRLRAQALRHDGAPRPHRGGACGGGGGVPGRLGQLLLRRRARRLPAGGGPARRHAGRALEPRVQAAPLLRRAPRRPRLAPGAPGARLGLPGRPPDPHGGRARGLLRRSSSDTRPSPSSS